VTSLVKLQEPAGEYIVPNKRFSILVSVLCVLSVFNFIAPAMATGSYSVAGFDDAVAFERFYDNLRKDVAKGDKQATAALFSYPMSIRFPPKKKLVDISNQAEMVKNFDRIFNPQAKNALQKTKTGDLFCNCQGVMIGGGEIWFTPGDKGGVSIKTVNPIR
jgi:hypothetical protein